MIDQTKFQIGREFKELREAVRQNERLVVILNELSINVGRGDEDVLLRFLDELKKSGAPGEQLEAIAARVVGADFLKRNAAKIFELAQAVYHESATAFSDFQTKNAVVLRELTL